MLILGIESSCDETGVALVRAGAQGLPQLLAHGLHSQVNLHEAYGGVVPEVASRDHIRRVVPLIRQVCRDAQLSLSDIDGVAFTQGPGLAGALLVGAGVAVSLACSLGIPAWPVHHLEGHLLSPFLSQQTPSFPFIALLVSGGHTQLMRVDGVGQYRLLGESIDDAAGEAFDKSAKMLGLPYPGGALLSKLAQGGRPDAYRFPRPLMHSQDLQFSFAGLKTAVRTCVLKVPPEQRSPQWQADVAASAQAAIVDILVHKSLAALKSEGLQSLVLAGGVGANQSLRQQLLAKIGPRGGTVHFPELQWCTDNGAMMAMAAAMRWQAGRLLAPVDGFEIKPRWPLDAVSGYT